LLEVYQTETGIKVPEVLKPYLPKGTHIVSCFVPTFCHLWQPGLRERSDSAKRVVTLFRNWLIVRPWLVYHPVIFSYFPFSPLSMLTLQLVSEWPIAIGFLHLLFMWLACLVWILATYWLSQLESLPSRSLRMNAVMV